MFSAQFRLKSSRRIAQVFRNGKYSHGKYVFIKYLPNKTDHVRIALGVSSKLFKEAVQRNRIKRLIREAMKVYGLIKIPPLDIIVIPKKSFRTDTPLVKIQKDLSALLSHL